MDKALKQRLVGASVLIALAVIVLPMLLGGKPEGSAQQSQKIELPPRPDELNFETRRFQLGEAPAAAPVEETTQEPAVNRLPEPSGTIMQQPATSSSDNSSGQDRDADSTDEALLTENNADDAPANQSSDGESGEQTQTQPTSSAPVPVTQSTVSPEPSSGRGRYLVQVASLGSDENARRLMANLQQKGYPVLLDTVTSDVGRLNRVRVGPFENDSAASSAASRIRGDIDGVNPRVVDLNPNQVAAATSPSDPLVRWVVQVGSFGQQANADNLVKKLRDGGMTAYRESRRSGTSTIYRVRVGPFLEREEAMRAKQNLLQNLSIDGVVMSAD